MLSLGWLAWHFFHPAAPQATTAPAINLPPAAKVVFTHTLPPHFSDEATDLDVTLPVRNDTGEFISFKRVDSFCTCSAALLGERQLAPGEETTLRLTAHLRGRTGSQNFAALLQEASGRWWEFRVQTTLYERARFDVPNSRLCLRDVNPRAQVSRELDLILTGDGDDIPTHKLVFEASEADWQLRPIRIGPVEQMPDGCHVRRVSLRLKHTSPAEPGLYDARLTCRYPCKGQMREARLSVTETVRSLYSVTPPYVVLRAGKSPSHQDIIIRRSDGKPLHVQSAQVYDPRTAVRLKSPDEPFRATLEFSVNPMTLKASTWGTIVLKTDHEVQPSFSIPFAILLKEEKQ